MSFLKGLSTLTRKVFTSREAYAHCDIPCGIYDPHLAQIAALTTVRMNQLIEALVGPSPDQSVEERKGAVNSITRYIAAKEEHAEVCKRELRILWSDYFKPEHVEAYPDIHDRFWNALKLASTVRQQQNLQASQDLLAAVQGIAEIFWKTKGADVSRQPSRQGAAGGELIYPA